MSTIGYNAELMNAITANYNECAMRIDTAISKLVEAKNGLQSNYEGQGSYVANDVFVKTEQHLSLLKDCLVQAGKYVAYTKETATSTDIHVGENILAP